MWRIAVWVAAWVALAEGAALGPSIPAAQSRSCKAGPWEQTGLHRRGGGRDRRSQTSWTRLKRKKTPPVAVQEAPLVEPPTAVNVSIVSWNLGMKSPSMSDMTVIQSLGMNASDIIVLGVQEIENIKPRRKEGSRSREWRNLVLKTFSRTHVLLSLTSMGPLQLAVLARRPIVRFVSPLHICQVACGVGNVLYNKGAQAALFKVCGTPFLLINAHLAAHQHKIEDRNSAADRIMTELQTLLWFHLRRPGERGPRRPLPPNKIFSPDELLHKVDRLFFFGDLNYRLELPRDQIEIPLRRVRKGKVTQSEAVERLLEYDQLDIEKAKGRVFAGLDEGRIKFMPTFKYNKGRDGYDTSPKRRAPAWTDRILYKPCGGAVRLHKYDSVQSCKHSDHRPVYAHFTVDVGRTDAVPPLDSLPLEVMEAVVTAKGGSGLIDGESDDEREDGEVMVEDVEDVGDEDEEDDDDGGLDGEEEDTDESEWEGGDDDSETDFSNFDEGYDDEGDDSSEW